MKRSTAGWMLGVLLFGATLGLAPATAGASPAQQDPTACFPGTDPDYPPTGNQVQIEGSLSLLSAQFNVGATGTIVLGGAAPNAVYCGTAFSTPIVLPSKQADTSGRLNYTVAVPADFELGAMHHIDVFRSQVQVGSFDFCVNKSGSLAPNSQCATKAKPPGNLARTGFDRVMDLSRFALVFLGVGAGALYLRRRRAQAAG